MNLYNHSTIERKPLTGAVLCVIFGGVLASGCSTTVVQVNPEITQESLLTRCPETLPSDYSTEGKYWILMAEEWSSIYHECKIRHNGLVDAIKEVVEDGD